jgi:hypothetical protein
MFLTYSCMFQKLVGMCFLSRLLARVLLKVDVKLTFLWVLGSREMRERLRTLSENEKNKQLVSFPSFL